MTKLLGKLKGFDIYATCSCCDREDHERYRTPRALAGLGLRGGVVAIDLTLTELAELEKVEEFEGEFQALAAEILIDRYFDDYGRNDDDVELFADWDEPPTLEVQDDRLREERLMHKVGHPTLFPL